MLPGVTVTVTHQGTTLTRDTVSDARGEFTLPALPPGTVHDQDRAFGIQDVREQGIDAERRPDGAADVCARSGGAGRDRHGRRERASHRNSNDGAGAIARRGSARDSGLAAESAERHPPGLGYQLLRQRRRRRPGVPRQRRRRRWQRHHGGRQQRPDQPRKSRLRQLRRPEPDRDPECRSGRRGAGGQGRPAGGVRRLDRRSGQHDHAFGDQPVPRIGV